MEVSGVVFRRVPWFWGIGAGMDSGKLFMNGGLGFRDRGHLQYYYGGGGGSIRCQSIKKKLKLLKGLSKDLSDYKDKGLLGQVQGNMVQEAAETLLKQLQHLRAEEKETNKRRKQEKAKLKATRQSSSSSSSSSSDSECGEAIDMTRLRNEATAHPILSVLHPPTPQGPSTSTSCSNVCSLSSNDDDESSRSVTKRIEVCMGNKCKKSGGAALLEEFERALGVEEAAVVGCKCMGKCRDGPNVRVFNSVNGIQTDDSVRTPPNPLCIGVALEDVGVIVANFFAKDLDFTSPPSS